jgi:hypothetical protein
MIVAWPYLPLAPGVALYDKPERYDVYAYDETLDSLARAIRLGQSVDADLTDAAPPVQVATRFFLAGICAPGGTRVQVRRG